jgi:hypothetical protein
MPIDRPTYGTLPVRQWPTSGLIEALVETACVDTLAHELSFTLVKADGQAWRDELRAEIDRRIPVPPGPPVGIIPPWMSP